MPHPSRGQGPHGLGVPNERFLFAGVKGQVLVRGVVGRWVGVSINPASVPCSIQVPG